MVQAQLDRILNPEFQEKSERYESFRDGGGGIVLKEDVRLLNTQVQLDDNDALLIVATKDGASVEATLQALDLPDDWADFGTLLTVLKNGSTRLKIELSLLGARNRIIDRRWLEPGETTEISFNLSELPLIAGHRPPYQPTGLRLKIQWGDTWETDGQLLVTQNQWPATDDNNPVELTWVSTTLSPRDPAETRAVVDQFGQRLRSTWPTKVNGVEHFTEVQKEEDEWLDGQTPPAHRSQYGGDTSLPQQEATGFFRVQQIDGVWWYIDPDGHPFWSVGTTGIRVSDTTLLEGMEMVFGELPDRDGPYAQFYTPPIGSPANDGKGKEVVSFYLLNVLKKYGSLEAWRDQVVRRFKVWGYNTFGNWSDELMITQREIPHTRALTSRVGEVRINNRFPDVFDPQWEQAFDQMCAREVAPQKDNPWLLGYFVDNEIHWRGLHNKILLCDEGTALRKEWARWAEERYESNLSAFNADFASSFASWDELASMAADQMPSEGLGFETALAFAGHFAENYFMKINAMLKKHDPNHLYLGCRFVRKRPEEAICYASRHCDVVTVNCYSMLPEREQFKEWHELTTRPIQIGEHHLPLESNRQCPPLYAAFTSEEREDGYANFLQHFAEQPWSLGAHWFQFADQNATGRPSNGENQTIGFVDITDRPHPELVNAVMRVTREMYQWHHHSKE